MEICWVTIHVNDLEESIKFYEDIFKLECVERFAQGDKMELAFMQSDSIKLEFLHIKNNKKPDIGNDISIGFEIESMDEWLKKFEELNIEVHGIVDGGVRYFFIHDPNGLKIQLFEAGNN